MPWAAWGPGQLRQGPVTLDTSVPSLSSHPLVPKGHRPTPCRQLDPRTVLVLPAFQTVVGLPGDYLLLNAGCLFILDYI